MFLFKPNVQKLKEQKDVKGLIKALDSKDSDLSKAAADALVEVGEPAVEPLFYGLSKKTGWARMGILMLVARIGEPAVDTLIAALSYPVPGAQGDAITTLCFLPAHVNNPAPFYRIIDPLIAAYQRQTVDIWKRTAVRAIGHAAAKIADSDERTRAIDFLAKAFQNSDPEIRIATIEVLGEIGNERALELLQIALKDKDAKVRQAATESLKKPGSIMVASEEEPE